MCIRDRHLPVPPDREVNGLMDVLYGLAKDFVFKDAVAFLKGKKALTSEEYRLLDDESLSLIHIYA